MRARCPDARLEEALAESWLEQGRLAAVARLLATPTALAPAVRSSIAGRLEQARQHPRDPDALLEKARAAKRRGDAVHARRHYDQALARLSASLDEGEAPTLLFLEPATPHRLDDDYLGPPSGTDDGDLHLYPARELDGRLGAALAALTPPARPFRWFVGGAEVVDDGVLFAGRSLRRIAPSASSSTAARGWSRSPAGGVVLVDTEDAVEQWALPALRLVARTPLPGPTRSYRWLDGHRVVVRSSGGQQAAQILDTRRPGTVTANVSGMLEAVADDGAHLARVAAGAGADVVSVVDGTTDREVFRHDVSVTGNAPALAFSPDGTELVFVPGDGTASIFAVPSGRKRVAGSVQEPPWHSVSSAWVSDEGWVCLYTRHAHWGSCEPRTAMNLRRAAVPPGHQATCFRDKNGVSVALLPTRPQTAGRERIASASGPAVDVCLRAKGPRFAAWLESQVTGDGPMRSHRDVVVVVWDLRRRRVLRTISLEGVRFDSSNAYGQLAIEGETVRGELGAFRFVVDVAKGAAQVEPIASRTATTGFPLTFVELSDAGFARSEDGQVIDVRTGAAATPPVGASWTSDEMAFEGLRFRVEAGRLRVDDGEGEHLATIAAYAKGVAVATFPDGQLELLGTSTPDLGCLFGTRVTELDVCEERHLTEGRFGRLRRRLESTRR
ncbi:MAG: hypothetical protein RIF41_29390 [Polyangiaceae bacterium]